MVRAEPGQAPSNKLGDAERGVGREQNAENEPIPTQCRVAGHYVLVGRPSVRSLARRLGIHRNTVTQAYRDPVLIPAACGALDSLAHDSNWHHPYAGIHYQPPFSRLLIPMNNVLTLHT